MIFSNNMEYEDGASEPLQGAFYASTSYGKPIFNYFRDDRVWIFKRFDWTLDVLADSKMCTVLVNRKSTIESFFRIDHTNEK